MPSAGMSGTCSCGRPSPEVDLLVARHSLEDIVRRLEPHGKVDLVGRSFGVIKFTIEGHDLRRRPPPDGRPRGSASAASQGPQGFRHRGRPVPPGRKGPRAPRFPCEQHRPPPHGRSRHRPFRRPPGHPRPSHPRDQPGRFPGRPPPRPPGGPVRLGPGLPRRPKIYATAKDVDLSGLSVERVTRSSSRSSWIRRSRRSASRSCSSSGPSRQLFPELYALTLCIQDSIFHPETDAFGHHTVWPHTKL